jgi:hypothetical protein
MLLPRQALPCFEEFASCFAIRGISDGKNYLWLAVRGRRALLGAWLLGASAD